MSASVNDDSVRMTHPTLTDQPISVPASAVPHWRSAGWVVEPDQGNEGEQWPAELTRFEGQEQVRLRHPDLDEEITVAGSAVAVHEASGWVPVEASTSGTGSAERGANLDAMTVAQLQDEIRARNERWPEDQHLPVSGTKPELLERLRSAPPAEQDQAEADAAQADTESEE